MTAQPDNLVTVFRERIATNGDTPTIAFYDRAGRSWRSSSQAAFLRRAATLSQRLARAGAARGVPVIVACAAPEAALLGFVGAVFVGAVPAILPIRPTFDTRQAIGERITATVAFLGPETIVLAEERDGRELIPPAVLERTHFFRPADLAEAADLGAALPAAAPEDTLHVQLTSGSTGAGKGVVVTHANVMANAAAVRDRTQMTAHDSIVSWLPLYHDMGLGMAFISLLTGFDVYFMRPFDFLADPQLWLRTISEKRATIGVGPNFSYDFITKRFVDGAGPDVDLSAWRLAFCGAEPISAATIRAFYDRFTPYGLRPSVFTPCYGLAEATLAATLIDGRAAWRSIVVSRPALTRLGKVEYADADAGDPAASIEVVALGPAVDGLAIALVDEVGGRIGDEMVCGEVLITGTSVAAGWLAEGGVVQPFPPEGLHTGDIGFFEGGDLFVVERAKNIIIRNGQNYSAQVLEQTPAELGGVSVDDVLVLDRDILHGRGLTGVIEVDKRGDPQAVLDAVIAGAARFDPPLEALVAVRRGILPQTTSGKKRHLAVREALNAGTLRIVAQRELSGARRP